MSSGFRRLRCGGEPSTHITDAPAGHADAREPNRLREGSVAHVSPQRGSGEGENALWPYQLLLAKKRRIGEGINIVRH